ncbi:hypothetical protein OH77DRAFT_1422411 [Trametes cingulata]|nr:hypothetical protein OH77DRAFT_1422411 [Trametes cingulata]
MQCIQIRAHAHPAEAAPSAHNLSSSNSANLAISRTRAPVRGREIFAQTPAVTGDPRDASPRAMSTATTSVLRPRACWAAQRPICWRAGGQGCELLYRACSTVERCKSSEREREKEKEREAPSQAGALSTVLIDRVRDGADPVSAHDGDLPLAGSDRERLCAGFRTGQAN